MANIARLHFKLEQLVKDGCFIQTEQDQFLILTNCNSSESSFEENHFKPFVTLSPFYCDPTKNIHTYNDFEYLDKTEILDCLQELIFKNETNKQRMFKQNWQTPLFSDFNDSFQTIQNWIQSNEVQKAVPTIFERSSWTPTSVFEKLFLLKNAIENSAQHQRVYAIFNSEYGMIGATPEVLFELKGTHLKTMALAGTLQKTESTQAKDLLNSTKDLDEHNFVVEFIKNNLSTYGDVKSIGPAILELPTLYHLKSDIEVKNINIDPFNLLKALHPTPALGIFSTTQNWKILQKLPFQKNRNWFGAPLGIALSKDHFLALVCIRNIEWNSHESFISVGCGIVKESKVEKEWDELFYKRMAVKKLLNLSALEEKTPFLENNL